MQIPVTLQKKNPACRILRLRRVALATSFLLYKKEYVPFLSARNEAYSFYNSLKFKNAHL